VNLAMTEYWVSQARHWCEYCRIFINGTKPSIAFHENGRKHKEIVELFLRDMRKRGRDRRIEKDDTAKELAKIEREAMKQYQREDVCGYAGAGAAGPPPSEQRAARLAQLEATMARARQEREERLAASASASGLPFGWEEAVNPDGKTFYTHTATGLVQWERPGGMGSGAKSMDGAHADEPSGRRDGWEQGWTEEGVPYYYNTAKGITQWEVPAEWASSGDLHERAPQGSEEVAAPEADIDADGHENTATTSVDDASVSANDQDPNVDPNTGLGAWQVVEPSSSTQDLDDKPPPPKRPRGFGPEQTDEEEILRNFESQHTISDEMKAAVARLEEQEKEAEAAAGAAPVVFKKRTAGKSGFRKKTGI